MKRLWEILFGLEKGFLNRPGDLHPQFNPKWPGQEFLDQMFYKMGWVNYHNMGAVLWNVVLGALGLMLVAWVYHREGRGKAVRIALGTLRTALLAFVLVLLNHPVLVLVENHTEPSVVAVLIDDSMSMKVPDAGADGASPLTRLDAVKDLVNGKNQKLIYDLARKHNLRFYRFSGGTRPLPVVMKDDDKKHATPVTQPTTMKSTELYEAVAGLQPDGQSTQVVSSLKNVLEDLQGLRLAGIVLLTDGRDSPVEVLGEAIAAVKNYQVPIYPVAIGSEKAPVNLSIDNVVLEDSIFDGDLVSVTATIRGTGLPKGFETKVVLSDVTTGLEMKKPDGTPSEEPVRINDDKPQQVELVFKPEKLAELIKAYRARHADELQKNPMDDKSCPLPIKVEIPKQPGELDDKDNVRMAQTEVLDAKISVLYCDGYPRWEYRYLTREMMHDKNFSISCLLFSADTGFFQEGTKPITRFPQDLKEMLDYDVVLFGDVDPRQFTERQFTLISDFVSKKGGGFGMVAGPRWAPFGYRNTPLEAMLPVNITHLIPEEGGTITSGFRPVLTRDGAASSIFRFFTDKATNEKYLKEDLQPLFWYSRGATLKPGVGEVYAEHPNDTGPDGRKAPILVVGRFGAGRTLFSAIDDSWRWRFYTGEQIFDTYWVQQLRYLARSKKLGQRKFTAPTPDKQVFERGEEARLSMRILDPELLQQLPDQISVEIVRKKSGDEKDDARDVVRHETFNRQEGSGGDLYVSTFAADMVGNFVARVTGLSGDFASREVSFAIADPRLELAQPEVDKGLLSQLAGATEGQMVPLADARDKLGNMIMSRSKDLELKTPMPIWDAPLGIGIFVLLITVEWVLRKVYGML